MLRLLVSQRCHSNAVSQNSLFFGSKYGQKVVTKLSKNSQKLSKKLAKKWSKNCQKVVKNKTPFIGLFNHTKIFGPGIIINK
jgi:hypothetical protein